MDTFATATSSTEAGRVRSHFWNHLTRLYGHDLTSSVADNDKDYGPVFLSTGLQLPNVSESMRLDAVRQAEEFFWSKS
ncbi:unknown protein [Desulfotalea psychrophila LSv54]|uniref:Uncharacterized protein n=1 Tax=Desulfotalea psychrophila (strain LSv54 / DSM 12343) TaxID=177439 RepID=Q6ALI4_DESPS|nr:unknown protein [Desulfotalea psychrophila LSv54]